MAMQTEDSQRISEKPMELYWANYRNLPKSWLFGIDPNACSLIQGFGIIYCNLHRYSIKIKIVYLTLKSAYSLYLLCQPTSPKNFFLNNLSGWIHEFSLYLKTDILFVGPKHHIGVFLFLRCMQRIWFIVMWSIFGAKGGESSRGFGDVCFVEASVPPEMHKTL